METLSVVVWNVQFRPPESYDGQVLRARTLACNPDIVCITEGLTDFLDLPHVILASDSYGYAHDGRRRKVMLWSRMPWTDIDNVGHADLPPGRFVAGTTVTPIGSLRVHGICIPWAQAHVRTGRRDSAPWQEHRKFVAGLAGLLHGQAIGAARVVMGDYNQRLPRRYAPRDLHNELVAAFPDDMACMTSGEIAPLGRQAIDHLHCSTVLEAVSVTALSNISAEGREVSDHFGLHVTLKLSDASITG